MRNLSESHMASTAYTEYRKNLKDVHRLVLLHRELSGAAPGRRSLGHLTRGGLLLLCAAWERYMETLAMESANFLISRLANYSELPAEPRERMRDYANAGGNTWNAADLATQRWKLMFRQLVERRVGALNTPKHEQLRNLFNHFFSVPDIGVFWTPDTNADIDEFVSLRGEVAHRGAESRYIRFHQLERFEESVSA